MEDKYHLVFTCNAICESYDDIYRGGVELICVCLIHKLRLVPQSNKLNKLTYVTEICNK